MGNITYHKLKTGYLNPVIFRQIQFGMTTVSTEDNQILIGDQKFFPENPIVVGEKIQIIFRNGDVCFYYHTSAAGVGKYAHRRNINSSGQKKKQLTF